MRYPLIEKAIALNPRYPEAYGNLGNVLRDIGDLPEAVNAYEQALKLNPAHADTHNNLGVAKKEQGHTRDAIACYRRALELRPTHAEAYNNLGLALMEIGTLHDAIGPFSKRCPSLPGYQLARYNLGMAWSWAGDDSKPASALSRSHGPDMITVITVPNTAIYRSRIKHDAEQVAVLVRPGKVGRETSSLPAQSLRRLQERLESDSRPETVVRLSRNDLTDIAPSFNRILS